MIQFFLMKFVARNVNLKVRYEFPKTVNNSRKSRLSFTFSEMSLVELYLIDME